MCIPEPGLWPKEGPGWRASGPNFGRQGGISLIELIVFIVVVGVAVTGVLSVLNLGAAHSFDPAVRRQALAVAESLLEEIASQPFTWCDPTDPAATTANSASDCTLPEVMGPESGQTRYGPSYFNNVNDYAGFSMNGIAGLDGAPIPSLAAYSASVLVSAVGASFGLADASAALQVEVTVSGGGETVKLEAFRFRHSPKGGA